MVPSSQLKSKLIFVALILLSLATLAVYLNQKEQSPVTFFQKTLISITSPAQKVVNAVISPVRNTWRAITQLSSLEEKNMKLQKEVNKLKQGQVDIKEVKKENERLRSLLAFKKKTKYESMLATIIGISNSPQSILVIDKGTTDGIKELMPVLVENGLLGKVIMSVNHASQVQLLTDPKSSVGARVKSTGAVGIVEGEIGERLLLKYLPKNSKIKINDLVITSGLGGVFPKDITIGKVSSIEPGSGTDQPIIEIKPSVNISKLDEVFVITNPPVELPKILLGN